MGSLLVCVKEDERDNVNYKQQWSREDISSLKNELESDNKNKKLFDKTKEIDSSNLLKIYEKKEQEPCTINLTNNETSNKRILCYNEYGSKSGFPIIHFHGLFSSRMEGLYFHRAALNANIRIICADRPGIGLSTFDNNTSYESICNDIKQLIITLKLKSNQYGLMGFAEGACFSLHQLFYLQNEITPKFVMLINGLPSWSIIDKINNNNSTDNDIKFFRDLYVSYPRIYNFYSLFKGFLAQNCWCIVRKSSLKYIADHEIDEIIKKIHYKSLKYSMSGEYGTKGVIKEEMNILKDWTFDMTELKKTIPIICYHGDEDNVIPLEWMKIMNDELAQVSLGVCNGYGHMMLTDTNIQENIMKSIQEALQ